MGTWKGLGQSRDLIWLLTPKHRCGCPLRKRMQGDRVRDPLQITCRVEMVVVWMRMEARDVMRRDPVGVFQKQTRQDLT